MDEFTMDESDIDFDPGCAPECEDCQARTMDVDENGVSYSCNEEVCILDEEV